MKTRYFNTGFVSLQYKNTNQYCAKLIQKNIWENHKFLKRFLKFFYLIFWNFFRGWVQRGPYGLAGPSKPGSVTGSNQWPGWGTKGTHEFIHTCMNSAKVIKLPSHSSKTHLQRKKGNERTWCWRRRSRWWCRVSSVGFLFLWPSPRPLSCYWFLILLPLVQEDGVVERWCCFNSVLVGRSHAGFFLLDLVPFQFFPPLFSLPYAPLSLCFIFSFLFRHCHLFVFFFDVLFSALFYFSIVS